MPVVLLGVVNLSISDMDRWGGYGSDWPEGHRECLKCNKIKPFKDFHKHSRCKFGVNSVCKICRLSISKKQWGTVPLEKKIFQRAKTRATKKGLEFSIEPSDIIVPDLCPIFGIKMEYNTEYSPSIDRTDSSKGYIKGNVEIISSRANTLKNNASKEELEMILKYLKNL